MYVIETHIERLTKTFINDQEKHLIQSFKKSEQFVVNKTYIKHIQSSHLYCMGYIL